MRFGTWKGRVQAHKPLLLKAYFDSLGWWLLVIICIRFGRSFRFEEFDLRI